MAVNQQKGSIDLENASSEEETKQDVPQNHDRDPNVVQWDGPEDQENPM